MDHNFGNCKVQAVFLGYWCWWRSLCFLGRENVVEGGPGREKGSAVEVLWPWVSGLWEEEDELGPATGDVIGSKGRFFGKLLNLPHLFGVFYGYVRLISILNVRFWCFGVVFGSCTAFYEWSNLHIPVLKVISLLIGWKWASQLASRNPWLWLAELCLALCWLDESNWRSFLIGWWAELTCI